MASELVTGSAGTNHVSSADDGSMFKSLFGAGRFALDQGSGFAASVVSANGVQIGTGACLMDGRYFRVTSPETLTIDSGAQGAARTDLIGVRYLYNSGTGVETGQLAVVKGTPVAVGTEPEPPAYVDGDISEGAVEAFFPLYSLTITGIVPGAPVKLFKTLGATVSCPWPVGAVLHMTRASDPNEVYPGTTWTRIQGAFLLGSSSGHALGATGGAETLTLTAANLPSHSHSLNSHTHGLNGHTHTYTKASASTGSTAITKAQLPSGVTGSFTLRNLFFDSSTSDWSPEVGGVFTKQASYGGNNYSGAYPYSGSSRHLNKIDFNLGGSGQGHTHTVGSSSATTGGSSGSTAAATGSTGATGSGTAVDKMPPFRVVDMWERTA